MDNFYIGLGTKNDIKNIFKRYNGIELEKPNNNVIKMIHVLKDGINEINLEPNKYKLKCIILKDLDVEFLLHVLTILLTYKNLKHLKLTQNDINDENCAMICELLCKSTFKLELLDLSYNNISHKSCKYIVKVLKYYSNSLKHFVITQNEINSDGFDILYDGILGCNELNSIDITQQMDDNINITKFFNSLSNKNKLETIEFMAQQFRGKDVNIAFKNVLTTTPALNVLSLCNSGFNEAIHWIPLLNGIIYRGKIIYDHKNKSLFKIINDILYSTYKIQKYNEQLFSYNICDIISEYVIDFWDHRLHLMLSFNVFDSNDSETNKICDFLAECIRNKYFCVGLFIT